MQVTVTVSPSPRPATLHLVIGVHYATGPPLMQLLQSVLLLLACYLDAGLRSQEPRRARRDRDGGASPQVSSQRTNVLAFWQARAGKKELAGRWLRRRAIQFRAVKSSTQPGSMASRGGWDPHFLWLTHPCDATLFRTSIPFEGWSGQCGIEGFTLMGWDGMGLECLVLGPMDDVLLVVEGADAVSSISPSLWLAGTMIAGILLQCPQLERGTRADGPTSRM
ncbi:hypothetical protein HU200_032106 [Digitaria exilis]|uniref:Uncharacterized protein n=1 Tax=Digitaria exilis TaxID=1010633 RepID=A0A835BTR0_9POAL|nr:hypothetical protein HU200_032106 [Digitaria exilis]